MERVELRNEELTMVTGGDYWTARGYKYVGHSKSFASNQAALKFAEANKVALRKKYGAYSFAYLVQLLNGHFVVRYYTK